MTTPPASAGNGARPAMQTPPVVSAEDWEAARQQLLIKEKALTRARDALAAERRRMPWTAVDKEYVFEGPAGRVTLRDLFDGRRQLIVYRAFHEPGVFGWPDHACRGCSMVADQVAHLAHLNARDTTLAFVSRAPQADIARLKARMGWTVPWVSSFGSAFNFDYQASFTKEELAEGEVTYNFTRTPSEQAHDELPGLSAFIRDEAGEVFHTYSSYARGGEEMLATRMILDRAPKGRNETSTLSFVKRHDEYEDQPKAHACCAA